MLFFFGALPIDQSKIKHTKKLKEIPSRHFLENLPEKASMYARVAEVAREHRWHQPKSLDSDKNVKP